MARLPVQGGDDNQWGSILNDFLSVELNSNGTLKKASDIAQAKADAEAALEAADNSAQLETTSPPPSINTTGSVLGNATTAARSNHTHALVTHTHANAANGGQLAQANTHSSADTDTATTALHHTLGTGANQAAAGNHTHTSLARGLCIYSGGAYPARPTGYAAVEFVGPVDPDTLAQENDTWINTA